MKANILVPLFVFILGSIITLFIVLSLRNAEVKSLHTAMVLSAKDYSKQFELNILNHTLRIQSLMNTFNSTPSKIIKDKDITAEILRNSIFARITIFVKQKNSDANGLPVLKKIRSSNLENDNLPKNNLPYMTSIYARKKIKLMEKVGEHSGFTFVENTLGEFATLIWKSPSNPKEYILFSSQIGSLFADLISESQIMLLIIDPETGLKLLVNWDEHGAIKIDKNNQLNDFESTHVKRLLFENKFSGSSSLTFKWYKAQSAKSTPLTWIAALIGLAMTSLIVLLLRFVLSQNRMVADLVINRTEDLESALNEATEANLAKTRFLGNMSHELRTPLNLILGMLELIEEINQDQKIKEYLKSIRVSGDHLLRLISDLLDMAKQDNREITVKNIPVRFPFFIEEIGQLIANAAQKKDLAFHVSIAPDIPELIKADPARLRQILMNLLRNSIKYTVSGYIELAVSSVKESTTKGEQRTTLRFQVKDTGVGIPEAKQNQIFERFLQLESSKILSQGGVGLGLSIVKDLVQILNGNITVKSEIGKGSVFTVDLDFDVVSAQPWTSAYIQKTKGPINVAILSDDADFINRIEQYLIFPFIQSKSFSLDQLTENNFNQSENKFTHYILDQRQNIDLRKMSDQFSQMDLILVCSNKMVNPPESAANTYIVDYEPLLPTPLLNCLGLSRTENKIFSATAAQKKQTDLIAKNNIKKLTVVIADDDDGNRQLFNAYLNTLGWNLIFAENGKEALEKAQQHKPDLVIADLRMPIMDGLELTSQLRADKAFHDMPIILVTADALDETEVLARKHGVTEFLTKPVRKTKILDAIFSVMKK